jgi:Cap4-like dsDNA endonuclease family protein
MRRREHGKCKRMAPSGDASLSADISRDTTVRPADDQSGREGFSRYRYQSKLTLNYWLQALLPNGPVRIYIERAGDLIVAHADRIRFSQIKTAAQGLRWTVMVARN